MPETAVYVGAAILRGYVTRGTSAIVYKYIHCTDK
jgi:hypothetical protein